MNPFTWFAALTNDTGVLLDQDMVTKNLQLGAINLVPDLFKEADADRDGKLSALELALYVFNLVDTDKNGLVTVKEAYAALDQVSIYTRLNKTSDWSGIA